MIYQTVKNFFMHTSSSYRVLQWSLNSKVVFISAFFYCISFVALDALFWCIIPSLFLLFFVVYENNSYVSAWRCGFLWGSSVYGFHCGLIFYSLYLIKPHAILIVGFILATLYLSLYVILLFLISVGVQRIIYHLRSTDLLLIIARLALTTLLLFSHFYVIEKYAFFVFGVEGGCCLASPVIPLTQFFPTICSVPLSKDIRESLGVMRMCYKPCQEVDPAACVQDFFQQVADTYSRNTMIQGVVTPESALPFALNTHPPLFRIFCDYSYTMPLLIGSFYKDKHGLQNCFYYFYEGSLQQLYIKRHAMPFIEMIPEWFDCGVTRNLFLEGESEHAQQTVYASCIRMPCKLINKQNRDVLFYPIICSELFCTALLKQVPENSIALILVNDAWFAHFILVHAAYKYACVQAWWYKKEMVYVSFCHA